LGADAEDCCGKGNAVLSIQAERSCRVQLRHRASSCALLVLRVGKALTAMGQAEEVMAGPPRAARPAECQAAARTR
jgi:hypothetical protein